MLGETSHGCVLSILPFAPLSSTPLVLRGMTDKSPLLRCRCVQYLCLLLSSFPSNIFAVHLEPSRHSTHTIFSVLGSVLRDPTPDVRKEAKQCFGILKVVSPQS
eukprot:TRINITY_DN9670_c0_g1_i1.p1 TRINITY_DN9670_c0_g1~~TRINITY_DN9670_c0_g1_i1.p1  ORF type:complete len:122 (-),score=21.94 TRINITY_DN9670_c0_g1_i1:114-425(-)